MSNYNYQQIICNVPNKRYGNLENSSEYDPYNPIIGITTPYLYANCKNWTFYNIPSTENDIFNNLFSFTIYGAYWDDYYGDLVEDEIEYNLPIKSINIYNASFFQIDQLLKGTGAKNINFINIDANNITNLNHTFAGTAPTLNSLNLSNWNVSKVSDMGALFYYSNIYGFKGVENWNTHNVKNMSYIFYHSLDDNQATSWPLQISNWNTHNVTSLYYAFGHLNFNNAILDISNWNLENLKNANSMFYASNHIKINWPLNCRLNNVTDFASMFYFANWQIAPNDISSWNTSKATSMYGMFSYTSGLINYVNLSSWKLNNVTNISNMFCNTAGMNILNAYGWNIGKVTVIDNFVRNVFTTTSGNYYRLHTLNVAGWNTSNITKCCNFVSGLHHLQNLDFTGWNLSKATNLRRFISANASVLTTASKQNIAKVLITAVNLATTEKNLNNKNSRCPFYSSSLKLDAANIGQTLVDQLTAAGWHY